MNYSETLDYLFSQLPMFSRIGAAAYKPDLNNTIRLCKVLGDPQDRFKTIHIAGTNGKGSVSHMLAAIFQAAGYKTGLYTSPHLNDFRERIRINGEMIPEATVIAFTEKIKLTVAEISPSFFEITVAMAFEHFAVQEVDIAIIETGLGGRLDSTNIIRPELSVITNIGWDHMNLLGDTLEKIAAEKGGIIKEGIPVVIGEVIPETKPVFERMALEKKSPMTIATEQRQVMDWHWEKNELVVEIAQPHHTDHKRYHLDLPGIYQARNLLTVLEACSVLQSAGWKIDEKIIDTGLRHTKKTTGLHGRWETIHHQPQIVLDVAHNADGIRQLSRQLESTAHRELHIIFGMVNDKDAGRALALFPKHAKYYFTRAQIPRALPEDQLMEQAEKFGLRGDSFPNVNQALEFALQHAHPDDLVIVCGSVFLVGEVDKGAVDRW
jgi:dihydrofolate synthase/folylpolyglutamate synthase